MNLINRKILITITSVAVLSFNAMPALAQGNKLSDLINRGNKEVKAASQAADKSADRLQKAKTYGDRMVDNRVAELNRVLSRIQTDTRLTSDEKSSLSSDIQNALSGLNQLKIKIDADTTVESVKTDAKSIITNYKVYAVLVPKIRLLITIDSLLNLNQKMLALIPKLDSLVATLQSQGKDVSTIQPLVADIKTRLQDTNTRLTKDKNTVLAVTMTSADPHATFVSVRQDLASVRASFAQVRADIGRLRGLFQNLLGTPKIASPSASK